MTPAGRLPISRWGAVEYKKDSGHAYWGTPLVPTSFAGSHAVNGVVSGAAINTFAGSLIGPITIDSRTLTTNYNIDDNATGAQELWVRGGFEWTPLNNVTIKDQVYTWQAKTNWLDSETYAFSSTSMSNPCPDSQPTCIARDRRDLALPELKTVRVTFRVRNLTNMIYAQWVDPGLAGPGAARCTTHL